MNAVFTRKAILEKRGKTKKADPFTPLPESIGPLLTPVLVFWMSIPPKKYWQHVIFPLPRKKSSIPRPMHSAPPIWTLVSRVVMKGPGTR